MSDPRYTDPRLSDPPLQDDLQSRRVGELEKSSTMWGWVAGGIVLARRMAKSRSTPSNPPPIRYGTLIFSLPTI